MEKLNIETKDYKVEDGLLTWVNCLVKDLILPEGILYFYYKPFDNCKELESIIVPETVKEISDEVFKDCCLLKGVALFDNLRRIGKDAFYRCKKLEEIAVPNTVEVIDDGAFYSCDSLKNVKLYDGLERIGNSAFKFCSELESITIPGTVKKIGARAFDFCRLLENVTLLEGLEEIGEDAFRNCGIKEITIPSSVRRIGYNAFEKCYNLENIIIKYNSYEELKDLISSNNKIFSIHSFEKIKDNNELNVIFDGPELSLEEQIYINELIEGVKIKINFNNKKNIIKNDKDDLIKYLEELNNYKKILGTKGELLFTDTVENTIKVIIYLANELDDEKKNEVLNALSKYIDKSIYNISLNIAGLVNKDSDKTNYKQEFELNVAILYDNLCFYLVEKEIDNNQLIYINK